MFKHNTWRRNSNSNNPGSRANVAQGEDSNVDAADDGEQLVNTDLTRTQYNRLLTMLKQDNEMNAKPSSSSDNIGSAAFMAGTSTFCFLTTKIFGWIIDSGAIDHMCYDLNLFDTYDLLVGDDNFITVPNGKKVIGNILVQ